MFANNAIETLAVKMVGEELPKPLLLLGAGFTHEPGVPSIGTVARETFATLVRVDPARAHSYLSPEQFDQVEQLAADDTGLLASFYRLFRDMLPLERSSLFGYYYSKCSSPLSYQIIADFVRKRRFTMVLMTYLDEFLTEVCGRIGLRRGIDYWIIDPMLDRKMIHPDQNQLSQIVTLMRLYGDVSERDTKTLLSIKQGCVFDQGCVSVGYDFSNPLVNLCLTQRKGELWWVGPHPVDTSAMMESERVTYYHPVNDEGANVGFDVFFKTLADKVGELSRQGVQGKELFIDPSDAKRKTPFNPLLSVPGDLSIEGSVPEKNVSPIPKNLTTRLGLSANQAVSSPISSVRKYPEVDNDKSVKLAPKFPQSQVSQSVSEKTTGLPLGNQAIPQGTTSNDQLANLAKISDGLANVKQVGAKTGRLNEQESKPRAIVDEDERITRITLLRQQCKSARELLTNMLQQQRLRVSGSAGLKIEIPNQQNRVAELEKQLLVSSSYPIIGLMNAIVDEASQQTTKSRALAFLTAQTKAIKEEYAHEGDVDIDIIAAAIDGALYMARRLKSVDQQKVSQLELYLPGRR